MSYDDPRIEAGLQAVWAYDWTEFDGTDPVAVDRKCFEVELAGADLVDPLRNGPVIIEVFGMLEMARLQAIQQGLGLLND